MALAWQWLEGLLCSSAPNTHITLTAAVVYIRLASVKGWGMGEWLLNWSVFERFGLFRAPGHFHSSALHFWSMQGPAASSCTGTWVMHEKGPLHKKRVQSLRPPLSLWVRPLPSPWRGDRWLDSTAAVGAISVIGPTVQKVSVFLEAHPLFFCELGVCSLKLNRDNADFFFLLLQSPNPNSSTEERKVTGQLKACYLNPCDLLEGLIVEEKTLKEWRSFPFFLVVLRCLFCL